MTLSRPSHSSQRPEDFGIGKLFWAMSDSIVAAELTSESIVLWNPAAERLFGYSEREALGMPLAMLVPVAVRPAHLAGIARFRNGGEAAIVGGPAVDVVAVTKSGETREIALSLADVSPGEERTHVLAIIRDVTEIRLARRDLERANASMREFVATASHDLRTPLTSLLGFAGVLAADDGGFSEAERKEFAQAILRGAKRASALVTDLLTLSQIRAGVMSVGTEVIELQPVVTEAMSVANVQAACGIPDGLCVAINGSHLERILINLLTNAAKYGAPPCGVSATVVGEMVEIVVSDCGPGVPEEFLPRLFQTFAQADQSRQEGAGLGLSIVQGLAEAHGGSAFYRARAGGGAEFGVSIPASGSGS